MPRHNDDAQLSDQHCRADQRRQRQTGEHGRDTLVPPLTDRIRSEGLLRPMGTVLTVGRECTAPLANSVARPNSPRDATPPPASGDTHATPAADSTVPNPPNRDTAPTSTSQRNGTAPIRNSAAAG
ncbi:hypothetical protein AB0L63_11455 [Nocardia sp. NPDC051990]|uniref:hypothetical protein n=1 Tax=Nocardia sp. NPDC051990 TaxID=3155285 RepID=UPI00342F5870